MSYSTSIARPQAGLYSQPLLGTGNYRVKACLTPVLCVEAEGPGAFVPVAQAVLGVATLGTALYVGHRIVRAFGKRRR